MDVTPSDAIRQEIPADFPLHDGKLDCLSCHDLTRDCKAEEPATAPNLKHLRGDRLASPVKFCLHCHAGQRYDAFNVHDQLQAGKVKGDTCLWCHAGVPDVNSPPGAQALLRKSTMICRNCHRVAQAHPAGNSHIGATPTSEMIWQMAAYEMQSAMRLSVPELLRFVRASNRTPRSMPLDEKGRITCYTCHNPHEKGLLPTRNPRAVGAEPKHAVNHRLRAHQDNMCVACHEK